MKDYKFFAKVRKTFIDHTFVKVRADTFQQAQDKAESCLEGFDEEDVYVSYVEARETVDQEILELDEVMEIDGA